MLVAARTDMAALRQQQRILLLAAIQRHLLLEEGADDAEVRERVTHFMTEMEAPSFRCPPDAAR